MRKKISINFKKLKKLFRNLIKDLRERTANKMMKSETVTKLNQKKTE